MAMLLRRPGGVFESESAQYRSLPMEGVRGLAVILVPSLCTIISLLEYSWLLRP